MILRIFVINLIACLPLLARTHLPPEVLFAKQFETSFQPVKSTTEQPQAIYHVYVDQPTDVNKISEGSPQNDSIKKQQANKIQRHQYPSMTYQRNPDKKETPKDKTTEDKGQEEAQGVVSEPTPQGLLDINSWLEEHEPIEIQNIVARQFD